MNQNKQPIGAHAVIQWLDNGEEGDSYYFSFGDYPEFNEETGDYGTDSFGVRDDCIFFYCDGEEALKSYMTKGAEDFIVLNYELSYKD